MMLRSRFLTPAVPKLDGGYTYSFCRLRHHWRGLALVSPVLLEDDVLQYSTFLTVIKHLRHYLPMPQHDCSVSQKNDLPP